MSIDHPNSPLCAAETSDQKRLLGQFFTVTNPFNNDPFIKWWKVANKSLGAHGPILEPFAGANSIVKLMEDVVGRRQAWASFDITPPEFNLAAHVEVLKRDTLADFPTGYKVAITNPPYLARNSASRRGLEFPPETDYADLYQFALSRMLDNCEHVAAIIPASFLQQGLMMDRLTSVIELNCRMFADTDCPVCLALFNGEKTNDFRIYRGDDGAPLGKFSELKGNLPAPKKFLPWQFNAAHGEIGLHALDDTQRATIRFVEGEDIAADRIRSTSRHNTRIKAPDGLGRRELERVIDRANKLLLRYRKMTHDVLLTPFGGLRADGGYRRRLLFAQARHFLDLAVA